jgi:methylphosphotriester-DNA--protein-cysteine methyltransferase
MTDPTIADDPAQSQRFIDMATEVGAGEQDTFSRTFDAVTKLPITEVPQRRRAKRLRKSLQPD